MVGRRAAVGSSGPFILFTMSVLKLPDSDSAAFIYKRVSSTDCPTRDRLDLCLSFRGRSCPASNPPSR